MGVETGLLIAGMVVAVVGAGVSAYGQVQQGKSQNAIAQFNAKQQESAAKQQALGLQAQAALMEKDAKANFELRKAEADARNSNADAIAQQASSQDAVNRLNIRKRREEFGRMQGQQRAAIAASGVSESTGTPLDLLAETAGKIQADAEEQHYMGEVQRRTLFSEEAMERLGGKLALAGATLNRDSAVSEAALRNAASRGEYLSGMASAEITRLTGKAAQSNSRYGAAATLLSQGSQNFKTASGIQWTTS